MKETFCRHFKTTLIHTCFDRSDCLRDRKRSYSKWFWCLHTCCTCKHLLPNPTIAGVWNNTVAEHWILCFYRLDLLCFLLTSTVARNAEFCGNINVELWCLLLLIWRKRLDIKLSIKLDWTAAVINSMQIVYVAALSFWSCGCLTWNLISYISTKYFKLYERESEHFENWVSTARCSIILRACFERCFLKMKSEPVLARLHIHNRFQITYKYDAMTLGICITHNIYAEVVVL